MFQHIVPPPASSVLCSGITGTSSSRPKKITSMTAILQPNSLSLSSLLSRSICEKLQLYISSCFSIFALSIEAGFEQNPYGMENIVKIFLCFSQFLPFRLVQRFMPYRTVWQKLSSCRSHIQHERNARYDPFGILQEENFRAMHVRSPAYCLFSFSFSLFFSARSLSASIFSTYCSFVRCTRLFGSGTSSISSPRSLQS